MPESEMRWTVIGAATAEGKVLCRCACGTEREVNKKNLKSGMSRSCGCANVERFKKHGADYARKGGTKHGLCDSPEYGVWGRMKYRCTNKRSGDYEDYGKRGITVCVRWMEFLNFRADMGERPSDLHSIDRIDNDKGYWCGKAECPECGPANREPNCRWATDAVQNRNRRDNHMVTYQGRTQCVTDWAREVNLPANTLALRIRNGWDLERAMTEPVHRSMLSLEEVIEIRRRYNKGSFTDGAPSLAREFGVSFQTVLRIVNGTIRRYNREES